MKKAFLILVALFMQSCIAMKIKNYVTGKFDYYWLLFSKSHGEKIMVAMCISIINLVFLPSFCLSQSQSDTVLQKLSMSEKLSNPEVVLKDFREGKSKTRVIVNLLDPSGIQKTRDLKNEFIREKLQEEVRYAQNRVINAMNPDHIRITNKFTYIFGFSAEVTIQGLRDLLSDRDVVSIDEDMILYAHLNQGIPLMNASGVRSAYNGAGMAIAICDTGIDYTHPKLGNGGFPNSKVIGGYDTGQDDSNPMDGAGHGTCCAGIAAGDLGSTGDYIGGVAYNAKLYALKITYSSTGGSAYTSDMVEAWEWCVTHQNDDLNNPIMIISTSFGGGRYYNQSSCDTRTPAMTQAAANAKAVGITLFVSSGNNGYCDSTGWPGCLSDVIGIGAVYDANVGGKYYSVCSDPSTAADKLTCYSNSATFLGLFAPSHDAYTTDITGSGGYSSGDYYDSFGGTSAACPYAAGAGACLQSAAKIINGSYLSPDSVESYLVNFGDLITDDRCTGIVKPRVNLGEAIANLLTSSTPTPSPTPYGDDNYEPNNTLATAWYPGYNWEQDWLSSIAGLGVQADDDWFRIDVSPAGYEQVQVDCRFTHSEGDIDISLYNSSGSLLAYSTSITDNEFIDYTVSGPGTYYIRVYYANAGNTYDLWWDAPGSTPTPPPTPVASECLVLDSGDYDGDGTSDIAVFRESSGLWSVRGVTRVYFGSSADLPISGDYDGDGTADIGIFRGSSGLWGVRGVTRLYYGSASDLPVPGDYDGDGSCDAGIFRPSSGLWAIRNVGRAYFGGVGDVAVPGDYDGDGSKDIAVSRPGSGMWAIRDISRIYFGSSGDMVVPGDYDGNGAWEAGIFRPSAGMWAVRGVTRAYYGSSSDYPVPADYNGDLTDDIGIFRSSSGLWAIRAITRTYFGTSGDLPVTR